MKETIEKFDAWLREPGPYAGIPNWVPVVTILLLIGAVAVASLFS